MTADHQAIGRRGIAAARRILRDCWTHDATTIEAYAAARDAQRRTTSRITTGATR